jgi:hypothetical protein
MCSVFPLCWYFRHFHNFDQPFLSLLAIYYSSGRPLKTLVRQRLNRNVGYRYRPIMFFYYVGIFFTLAFFSVFSLVLADVQQYSILVEGHFFLLD